MLKSPSHVTIGASHVETAARFFQTFGFTRESDSVIGAFAARELYGFDGPATETRLSMPGAERGFIRIVQTDAAAIGDGPFDRGPHSVALYVRDLTVALEVVKNTHAAIGGVVDHMEGPVSTRACRCEGPDGLVLVLIEARTRKPGLLDSNEKARFSEVHAAVHVVDSVDAAIAFWRSAGLTVLSDATLADPGAGLIRLPHPGVRLRRAVLADEASRPIRIEMIDFPDPEGSGAPLIEARPLRPGRFLLGFEVENVASAIKATPNAAWSKICRIGKDAVAAGTAPGGVGFELWSPDDV